MILNSISWPTAVLIMTAFAYAYLDLITDFDENCIGDAEQYAKNTFENFCDVMEIHLVEKEG